MGYFELKKNCTSKINTFFCLLLKVIKHINFIDFFSAIVWAQNAPFLHFLYWWHVLKAFLFLLPSINFYHLTTFILLLPSSVVFYFLPIIFITLNQFLPNFILVLLTFYHLSPTLYHFLLIKNGSISFFHLLTCANLTILIDAMLQALILCSSLLCMPWVVLLEFLSSQEQILTSLNLFLQLYHTYFES